MKKKLSILEVSACSNKQASKKLKFVGNTDERIVFMFHKILQKDAYDIISVRDISWSGLERVKHKLGACGYKLYIHKDWDNIKDKWRYSCLSAVFCREDVKFEQLYTSECFDTVFRYVYGKIELGDNEIFFKTSHIPCVDDSKFHVKNQIKRKESMLLDEIEFQKSKENCLAISAGDFNGAPSTGDFYCQDLFDNFSFVDTALANTYEDKMLDHCYISKALRDSDIVKVKTEVLNDYYMLFTDHKLITITLEAA